MKKIQVGFLLSYDYEKLKKSIPAVYDEADSIFLALDQEMRTWSGKSFTIEDSFFKWLEAFDQKGKIQVYKDNFYVPELSPLQNDTRERHMLSMKMGIGNWLVQIDADEVFTDFKTFVAKLRTLNHYLDRPETHPIQLGGWHLNLYKNLETGVLYVENPTKMVIATNYPNYKVARKTKERIIYTDALLIHECLARTEKDLAFKLENWGHSHQINEEFFDKWKKANDTNYEQFSDLFYLSNKDLWKSLGYFKSKDLIDVKREVENAPHLKPSKFFLAKKNFGQWFKHLKIFKLGKKPEFESYF
ncbi:hypothetical protein LRR18_11265 [Mangrovimonas sp. AS39]|uniref:hypothetical protein n=1 Tax=Mangrovimonas TaxID=1211036 RepID=UPI0014221743|nr:MULTISPECIES: hypothetical protein [Mangrovimonas]MCF1192164.1 hypothetical protein [Mangrovimonas futianensis]MCF1195858.1 hypothetical protein [Mangrovimonas futianensis]MCF1422181.1 hypothetical protein [Mangrovimonas futianensis]NIK92682.1 hypothetical protein [Mangrovimonas sp. CR14]